MAREEDEESLTSQQEWELDEGIPQVEDPFIQKYMTGRNALIEQEKKQRHDRAFKATMSPMAKQAAKILRSIRERELKDKWSSGTRDALTTYESIDLYPGMMFTLARDRAQSTETWRILERMPKGALLHCHLAAMFDVDYLVEEMLKEPGMHILAPEPLAAGRGSGIGDGRQPSTFLFRYFNDADAAKASGGRFFNIWASDYQPYAPVPIRDAQRLFPDDDTTFKKWLVSRCTISEKESLWHHHGVDAVWRKFASCFSIVSQLLFYEPVYRRAVQRLLAQLANDGIMYVEFRQDFVFQYFLKGENKAEKGHLKFFELWDEELKRFKQTEAGKKFRGARIIWTVIRRFDNRTIVEDMKNCIAMKRKFPHLISGFDCVGQEDLGRTLADLTPLLFWFRKQCVEAGVELPFFFHAGECLGDGDSTDSNLYDAVLLGTRRIGHGYSLFKHPLLIDMVKEKKILIESCPISNEILRLSSSILAHTLPALLSRGVAVSLNNDDPALLGHGQNGLCHDYWQAFMGFENLGLEGLGVMAENSIRWSAIEDQKQADWVRGITDGYMGKTVKSQLLKEWRAEFEKWCQWIIMEYPLEVDDSEEEDEEEEDDDEDDEEEEEED